LRRLGRSTGSSKGLPELSDTYPLVQRVDPRGQVQVRLLLPSLRLREESEDMQPRSDGHAASEAAPASRRISLNADSPHVTSSMP